MQDQRVGNTHVLRLDRGEEIVAELTRFCTSRGIGLGLVTGIGAVDRATIGLFRPAEKRYEATELTGDHEILSLAGNITTLNGEVYLHLHINLGDAAHRRVKVVEGQLGSLGRHGEVILLQHAVVRVPKAEANQAALGRGTSQRNDAADALPHFHEARAHLHLGDTRRRLHGR